MEERNPAGEVFSLLAGPMFGLGLPLWNQALSRPAAGDPDDLRRVRTGNPPGDLKPESGPRISEELRMLGPRYARPDAGTPSDAHPAVSHGDDTRSLVFTISSAGDPTLQGPEADLDILSDGLPVDRPRGRGDSPILSMPTPLPSGADAGTHGASVAPERRAEFDSDGSAAFGRPHAGRPLDQAALEAMAAGLPPSSGRSGGRGVPAAHVFAQFDSQVFAPLDIRRAHFQLDPTDFTLAGGRVLVGLQLKAAPGSTLDPQPVALVTGDGTPVVPEFVSADLAANRQSLALVEVGFGPYIALMSGERGTVGTVQLDVYLVGDVDGNRAVNTADDTLLQGMLGAIIGDGRYRVEADADLDGRITTTDVTFGQRNLGDSTRVNPLSVSMQVMPSPIATPGGLVTNVRTVTVSGTTSPGATVDLETGGDAGFLTVGPWQRLEGVGFQGDLSFLAPGSGSRSAAWTFTGLVPGSYRISATWFPHSLLATNAPFTIRDGGSTLASVSVNQELAPVGFTDAGAVWQDLGGPYTITSDTLTVRLSDLANEFVEADGIRIERIGSPARIIDDRDTSFTSRGPWQVYTGPFTYQGDVLYKARGTGADRATWTFTGLTPGPYRISTTWIPHPAAATNAPYTILDGGTALATVPLNQELPPIGFSEGGVTWQDLGGPYSIAGDTLTVRLTDAANDYVEADAMRIERVGPGAAVDDGDTGFGTEGTWFPYAGPGPFQADARFALPGTGASAATWSFSGLTPGQYRVAATWLPLPFAATNAPFTVRDATTDLATVRVNQQQFPFGFVSGDARWQYLDGVFTITGSALEVRLTDQADGVVEADAVRIERIESPGRIIDDTRFDEARTVAGATGPTASSLSSTKGRARWT